MYALGKYLGVFVQYYAFEGPRRSKMFFNICCIGLV